MINLKETILQSLLPILREGKHVSVNGSGVLSYAAVLPEKRSFLEKDFFASALRQYVPAVGDAAQLVLAYNAVNFAYWAKDPEKKWTYDCATTGKTETGSRGMFFAFIDAYRRDPAAISAQALSGMDMHAFSTWIGGTEGLVLASRRVEHLNDFGSVLLERHGGSVAALLRQQEYLAPGIVWELARHFVSYDDRAWFQGQELLFLKRAQLAVATLASVDARIRLTEQLTAFADYKVPLALRELGILKYSPELDKRIADGEPVFPGSRMELEIRAFTIWAVEQLRENTPQAMTSAEIDTILWHEARAMDRPYHHAVTSAY